MNPNLRLIALEEQGWDESFLNTCGGKIYTVYLYDSNSVIYCCELTPSYALYYVEALPAIENPSDDLLDSLNQAQEGEVKYFHCRGIDNIPYPSEYHRRVRFELEEGEGIEYALEYIKCNGGLYCGEPN